MSVMPVICPTITATNTAHYRKELENIQGFAGRIHIDFMDGIFAPVRSVPISKVWWQPGPLVDLHVMYKRPMKELENIVMLQPHLVVVHAEAEDILDFLKELEDLGIKRGLALLQKTPVENIRELLPQLDHVLIFSGDLGHHGGTADITLLHKAQLLKKYKPSLEIGWDGGINDENALVLVAGGVDVLNVGGYIQNAENPEEAYDRLKEVIKEGN